MKNMKRNLTFVSLLAVLVMALSFTSALGTIDTVEFNGVDLGSVSNNIAVSPGEVVPVWVRFTADVDASDVTLEVETKGRNGVSVSKDLSDIEDGSTYPVLLRLELPDTDDLSEEFTLYVTVSSKTEEEVETFDVKIKVQRESYDLDVLSVDYNSKVEAGDIFPVSVVVENNGYGFSEHNYVLVSVPALGISTRGYIGDLDSIEDYDNDNHEEDSVQKTVYLEVPEDAETGVYEMEVLAYNEDVKTVVTKLLAVNGVESDDDDSETLNDDDESASASVVALTVILVIIFVVLLAVLVVLLTKKEKPIEEVETSYY
jgi:hypothetical protein